MAISLRERRERTEGSSLVRRGRLNLCWDVPCVIVPQPPEGEILKLSDTMRSGEIFLHETPIAGSLTRVYFSPLGTVITFISLVNSGTGLLALHCNLRQDSFTSRQASVTT